MIKLGKACSQLMEANNTGKTKIKVVGNIFRLTFVFNASKNSSKFVFKLIDISEFIFNVRN
jgi:hypothetical protein